MGGWGEHYPICFEFWNFFNFAKPRRSDDIASMLPPVAISLEVEPQLEDIVLELASEAALVGVLPFPVDNLEGNVLQRGRAFTSRIKHLWEKRDRRREKEKGGEKEEKGRVLLMSM